MNRNPISLREGRVFIDGVECMDGVRCEITFSPEVWKGKQLGERNSSRRWLGYDITGSITRRRSTPFIRDVIARYKRSGGTPEFTIQGIMNDRSSEYFQRHGSDVVTVVGCVLTGDLALTRLDSGGEIVDDVIAFGAREMV